MIRWARERLIPVLQETMKEWSEDDGGLLAASMAYYAAFSFFPLLLIGISLLGLVLKYSVGAQDAQLRLIDFIGEQTSPVLSTQVRQLLDGMQSQALVSGPIGLITLLLGALGIFNHLEFSFNRLWDVPAPAAESIMASLRRLLYQRLTSFVLLLGLGLLVVLAFVISLALSALEVYSTDWHIDPTIWTVVQVTISLSINIVVFALVYKLVPRTHVPWRYAMIGAIVVAVVWEIGKLALTLLIVGNKYSAYGVVGSFIALMAWIYYASVILFLGAELVQVMCRLDRPIAKGGLKRTGNAKAASP